MNRDILAVIQENMNTFSKGQKRIANYILESYDKAAFMTASRLGKRAPQNYLFFGYLINKAKGIITDSGNVAEEATFLGIPCITLNTYAEHPETWRMGTNELVGEDPAELAKAMDTLMKGEWKQGELPERWDGRTAERIVQILTGK